MKRPLETSEMSPEFRGPPRTICPERAYGSAKAESAWDRAGSEPPEAQLVAELDAARRTVAALEAKLNGQASDRVRSNDRFTRLFDSNSVGIIVCDVHGHITEANDAFLDMLGYEHDDLPLRWDRMTPPEWRDLDDAKVQEILSTGAGLAWEKQYIARDGRRVPALVSVALMGASNGECLAIVHNISNRARLETTLRQRTQALRALAARLLLAKEHERRRIAAGLHDEIGQTLALAKLHLGKMRGAEHPVGVARENADVDGLLDEAIAALRSLTFELGSPVLHELGLEAALQSVGQDMEQEHGIRFHFQAGQQVAPLDADVSAILHRIVRELLNNVATHAQAQSATMSVQAAENQIRIAVEDDGMGFDVTDHTEGFGPDGGFGLFSIREQLDLIGGHFEVESAPGQGTRAIVFAPMVSIEDEAT